MPRKTIKETTDTAQIMEETAQRLNIPLKEFRPMFFSYWISLEIMMGRYCGHSTYVEGFGSFLLNPRGVYRTAKMDEKMIMKYMKRLKFYNTIPNAKKRRAFVTERLDDLATRIIFLNCSAKEYTQDVVGQYPKKYKIDHKHLTALVERLEQVFGAPITEWKVTIRYPIQKVYVRQLRKKGLLPNPIVDLCRKAA